MIENRDRYGRIERPPGPPHPLADLFPPLNRRDGRSTGGVPYADSRVTFRVPKVVFDSLKNMAKQRKISLTQLMLELVEPVVRPVIPNRNRLRDPQPERPRLLGQNQRLARLEDKRPSDVYNPIPPWDHIGRQQQRSGEKPPPTLVDRPRHR